MAQIPTSQRRPFISAPGVAQIEMVYTYMDVTAENVYHVDTGSFSAVDAPTLTAIADQFATWEANSGRVHRSSFAGLKMVRARDLTNEAGTVVERPQNAQALAGQLTDTPLPGNVTIAIKWSTGLGGRSFRGRTYHIGLTQSQVVQNHLATNVASLLAADYGNLMAAVDGTAGHHLAVLSFAHNKFWRSTALATPIVSASVDPNIDSQRRRLTGRGQ